MTDNSWPAQAFIIGSDILDSVSLEEVAATYHDMREMGLAKQPFPRFDIIVPFSRVIRVVYADGHDEMAEDKPGMTLRVRYEGYADSGVGPGSFRFIVTILKRHETIDLLDFMWKTGQNKPTEEQLAMFPSSAAMLYQLLVVMLATKNAVKETREHKMWQWSKNPLQRNRWTTTIKVGRVTEHADSHSHTGIERRPHLRRGHIRRQRFGPRLELTRQIWIEPIFVNADKDWIGERTAYNLSAVYSATQEKSISKEAASC